jgi:hypothetical protein
MPYASRLFVALQGDALAVKALKLIEKLDPGRAQTLVLDGEQLPTSQPAAGIVALFTFAGINGQAVKYPGNHLRVLREDDRTRPPVRRFEPPVWTRQSGQTIPIHQCVALRPRSGDETDELLAEALRSVYNQLTGAKVKVKPAPVGASAPPKVSGIHRRDSAADRDWPMMGR